MDDRPRISVVGLGRLGAPITACFAARGFEVVGYDPVPEKVAALNARRVLTYEPGFEELLQQVGPRLRATTDLADAVRSTDATFLVVPTPMAPDGGFSLDVVTSVCQEIGHLLAGEDRYHLVTLTSTVMPGATQRRVRPALENGSDRLVGRDIGLCYSAVFVTMGHVIRDFLHPSFTLVGEWDQRAGDLLERIYRSVCENAPPVARMSLSNAELAKLAVNVFVTTKISFANMLARICELTPGGNVDVVTQAMQHDDRVGHGALCGAIAYGGPFFDRDNEALGTLLKRLDVAPQLVGVLGRFNRAQVPWLTDIVHERIPDGGRAAVLGLSYKPDTDVIIGSVGMELCTHLAEREVAVTAHDPVVMEVARGALPRSVALAPHARAAIQSADVVVLATPWAVYEELDPALWARTPGSPRTVVDCWRRLPALATEPGITYVPLGVGPPDDAPADRKAAPPKKACG